MRSDIHTCVARIKSGIRSQLLLRHPRGGYQVLRLSELSAQNALDPSSKRFNDVLGVFNRSTPTEYIYEDAGEPVPGE